MKRRARISAFTLVELLVVAALIGLVAALAMRPIEDTIRGILRVRRDADANVSSLTVLETLARDIRSGAKLREITADRIALQNPHDESEITWKFDQTGVERTSPAGATRFPNAITELQIAADTQPPETRYVLIRGRFDGIGYIERGIALRGGR